MLSVSSLLRLQTTGAVLSRICLNFVFNHAFAAACSHGAIPTKASSDLFPRLGRAPPSLLLETCNRYLQRVAQMAVLRCDGFICPKR